MSKRTFEGHNVYSQGESNASTTLTGYGDTGVDPAEYIGFKKPKYDLTAGTERRESYTITTHIKGLKWSSGYNKALFPGEFIFSFKDDRPKPTTDYDSEPILTFMCLKHFLRNRCSTLYDLCNNVWTNRSYKHELFAIPSIVREHIAYKGTVHEVDREMLRMDPSIVHITNVTEGHTTIKNYIDPEIFPGLVSLVLVPEVDQYGLTQIKGFQDECYTDVTYTVEGVEGSLTTDALFQKLCVDRALLTKLVEECKDKKHGVDTSDGIGSFTRLFKAAGIEHKNVGQSGGNVSIEAALLALSKNLNVFTRPMFCILTPSPGSWYCRHVHFKNDEDIIDSYKRLGKVYSGGDKTSDPNYQKDVLMDILCDKIPVYHLGNVNTGSNFGSGGRTNLYTDVHCRDLKASNVAFDKLSMALDESNGRKDNVGQIYFRVRSR